MVDRSSPFKSGAIDEAEISSVNNPKCAYLAAGALLVVLIAELAFSVQQLSQTFDESVHIYSGLHIWRRDFGVNPEHPPLVKAVAALPILRWPLKEPSPAAPSLGSKIASYIEAAQLMSSGGAEAILFRTRMAAALFTILTALAIFSCGSEMFDRPTGLMALAFFVFEPNVLAHGALVTTDMGVTCFYFVSTFMFWRYVQQPGTLRLIMCGCAFALALAAKHSGMLVLPMFGALAVLEVALCRTSAFARGDAWKKQSTGQHALRLAIAIGVAAIIGLAGLWASYTFRFVARSADAAPLVPALEDAARDLPAPAQGRAVLALARFRILPESYLWGLTDVFKATQGRSSFIMGRVYAAGHWFYFPLAFLIKATIPIVLLLLLSGRTRRIRSADYRREVLFLAVPPALYFACAMSSGLNIGIRHILPVIPFVVLFCAVTAVEWLTTRAGRILVVALAVAHSVSSLHAYPNYLTYSNEIAGGPSATYRLLDDSNVDWGQQLKQVRDYLQRRGISECWFAYMVPLVNLQDYGIPCRSLPRGFGDSLVPEQISGTIFVSAFQASGHGWGPEEMNPYRTFFGETSGHDCEQRTGLQWNISDPPRLCGYPRPTRPGIAQAGQASGSAAGISEGGGTSSGVRGYARSVVPGVKDDKAR